MSKRVRWVCGECGVGALGSTRPRRDDVVRFCLRCSARVGRLVARTAPVLDRQRAAKRDRRINSKARKAVMRESLPPVMRDDLIRREFDRIAKCMGVDHCWLETIRRSRTKDYPTGHAWHRGKITITLSKRADWAEVCEVMLHEITHHACPAGEHHGDLFRARYVEGLEEAYGITLTGTFKTVYRYHGRDPLTSLDGAVEHALREKFSGKDSVNVDHT